MSRACGMPPCFSSAQAAEHEWSQLSEETS